MSLRFFARKKILPGVTLNMSKSGLSVSFGPRGLKHTIGPNGRRTTIGLPGTGLSYTIHHKKLEKAVSAPPKPRLLEPPEEVGKEASERENRFLRSVLAFQSGDHDGALVALRPLKGKADAHWLSGMIFLQKGEWIKARDELRAALALPEALGELFSEVGASVSIAYPITPEIEAHLSPEPRATRLALAEACQELGRHSEAAECLEALLVGDPDDVAARLSLAEILLDAPEKDHARIARLETSLRAVESGHDLFWNALLCRARALSALGRFAEAARGYEAALRDSGTPDELVDAARYEMALAFEASGDQTRCRQEFATIYASNPRFADVAERLKPKPRG